MVSDALPYNAYCVCIQEMHIQYPGKDRQHSLFIDDADTNVIRFAKKIHIGFLTRERSNMHSEQIPGHDLSGWLSIYLAESKTIEDKQISPKKRGPIGAPWA